MVKDFQNTIVKVQSELSQNPEWRARYKKYVRTIREEMPEGTFACAQKQFLVPAPFQLYMPLSTAVNECNLKRTVFELRFHGQSVAKLYVANESEKNVLLSAKKPRAVLNALLSAKMVEEMELLCEISEKGKIAWGTDNADARCFRKIYSSLEEAINAGNCKLKGQPEHDVESKLLENFALKSAAKKEISYIQPVTMWDTKARFQMPTPIKASNVKKGINTLTYSGKGGGGIDILARMGSGRNTTLTVMELKDENIASEPPEKAMCQAIAYATFLRELLRSDSGEEWWTFFGFGGSVPEELTIRALTVMPLKNRKGIITPQTSDFINYMEDEENRRLNMPKSADEADVIELGYIFTENGSVVKQLF